VQMSGHSKATTSLHHDRRILSTTIGADSLLTQLHAPLGRITHAANKWNLIYLIYPPTTTNESTHVSSEVQTPRGNPSPTHPYLPEGTQLPLEKERSGSPLLTQALTDKKEISRPDGKKSA